MTSPKNRAVKWPVDQTGLKKQVSMADPTKREERQTELISFHSINLLEHKLITS